MISLHAGRLLLFCNRADRRWHCRVMVGPKPEQQIEADTGATVLQDALQRARVIFRDAMEQLRPADGQIMCWDCLQWDPRVGRCELGIPECKRSGGRYAPRCEMYDAVLR